MYYAHVSTFSKNLNNKDCVVWLVEDNKIIKLLHGDGECAGEYSQKNINGNLKKYGIEHFISCNICKAETIEELIFKFALFKLKEGY